MIHINYIDLTCPEYSDLHQLLGMYTEVGENKNTIKYDGPDMTPFRHMLMCKTLRTTLNLSHKHTCTQCEETGLSTY